MTPAQTDRLAKYKKDRYLPGPFVRSVYFVRGTLTVVNGLHIGEAGDLGREEGAPEGNVQKVIRDAEKLPLIPSTSLRGVVRSFCERIIAVPDEEHALNRDESGVNRDELEDAARAVDLQHEDPAMASQPDSMDRKRANYFRDNLNLVAGIFGSTGWRSKVEFDPGRLTESSKNSKGELLVCMPRVAIDPHLRAAEDRKLFVTELVRPGVSFDIKLRAQNLKDWEFGLLLLAMDAFNHPYFPNRLGAMTAQGYGQMKWELSEIGEMKGPTLLADFVAGRRENRQGRPNPDPKGTVERCIKSLQEMWSSIYGQAA